MLEFKVNVRERARERVRELNTYLVHSLGLLVLSVQDPSLVSLSLSLFLPYVFCLLIYSRGSCDRALKTIQPTVGWHGYD